MDDDHDAVPPHGAMSPSHTGKDILTPATWVDQQTDGTREVTGHESPSTGRLRSHEVPGGVRRAGARARPRGSSCLTGTGSQLCKMEGSGDRTHGSVHAAGTAMLRTHDGGLHVIFPPPSNSFRKGFSFSPIPKPESPAKDPDGPKNSYVFTALTAAARV